MTEDELSTAVIGAAIEVHKTLGGPGLLEEVYEEALCHELQLRGFLVRRQVSLSIRYKGKELEKRLRIDLIVNDLLIVEVKAVETFNEVYKAQLLTYLRLSGKRLGLVLNFGEMLIRQGIHRVVNGLLES